MRMDVDVEVRVCVYSVHLTGLMEKDLDCSKKIFIAKEKQYIYWVDWLNEPNQTNGLTLTK